MDEDALGGDHDNWDAIKRSSSDCPDDEDDGGAGMPRLQREQVMKMKMKLVYKLYDETKHAVAAAASASATRVQPICTPGSLP